jgi:VWFA-related protein
MRRLNPWIMLLAVCLTLDGLVTAAGLAPADQQVTQGAPPPPPPTSQQPALTFRSTTSYVEIDAIVTDANGRFVRGLEPDEFDILEDGKPQKLTICSLVDIPVERPDPLLFKDKPIEPDVVTNEKPFDGRVFMIVLDGFHIATLRSAVVRKEARLFVEKYLGANDLVAVIHVGNPGAGQEFTNNKRLLLESIDRFTGQALNSATSNLIRDALMKNNLQGDGVDPGPPEDTERRERAYMARESVDSIRRLSEYMGGLSGRRKAVLFFSEGIDYETIDPPTNERAGGFLLIGDASAVRMSQTEMIASATRNNVSVYSIDPRGLTSGMEDAILVGSIPADATGGDPASTLRNYSQPNFPSAMADEVKIAQESLRLFSDQTGGTAVINQNDMDSAFGRILEENSSYYILGYVSPDSHRDGRFHRVSIRVKRPGLRVRSRNGYFAPSDKVAVKAPADPVNELLAHPAPVSGLGMHMSAAILRSADNEGRVRMTVEFTGKDVPLKNANNVFSNDIDVAYYAQSMTGKAKTSGRHVLHLRLLPKTYETFPQDGVRYVTEFTVPPGRYQVRVVAREQQSGKSGSIFHDFEVPDYPNLALAMSDLLITSSAADRTLTGKAAAPLGAKLPGQTTTSRTFSPNDTLSVFAAVYDTEVDRPHSIDLKVTVNADDGAQVFTREDSRSSAELTGDKGEFPYTISLPLRTLKPGRYVLGIEARSRLKGTTVKRETEFVVRQP